MSTATAKLAPKPATHGDICWSTVVRPAGFEPALPPPETGTTLIMPVSGVSRFSLLRTLEVLWCPLVHCTNPCTR